MSSCLKENETIPQQKKAKIVNDPIKYISLPGSQRKEKGLLLASGTTKTKKEWQDLMW